MNNEVLKFGALALGIALVILIIVLVVGHHKDKYEDVDSGSIKSPLAQTCAQCQALCKAFGNCPPSACCKVCGQAPGGSGAPYMRCCPP